MHSPTAHIPLTDDERRRIDDLAERLKQAWAGSGPVALGPLLPAVDDPLRPAALRELVKADLEIRWRRGRPALLETYLQEFPELVGRKDELAELLHEEYRVRQQHGDHPLLASYHERFPDLFDDLWRLAGEQPAAPPPAESSSLFPSGRPLEGNRLLPIGGGYLLESLIGRGGFGEVWRARAPGGVLVAVKIIRRPADHEERVREERALEVVKQLHHHFLARTHQYHSDKENLFIVMELADCSLRDRLREARKAGKEGLPADALVPLFREAAEALDYLHAKGVLHRDIKPDNILLVEGHVRLADFGLARLQNQALVSVSGSGTFAYMAPEVWGGKASAASDQYSLACSYAEMRLGRRPFTHTDYASLMFDHLQHTPDLGDMPEAEKRVVLQALAKTTDSRFPTCVDFARALERLTTDAPDTPTETPIGPPVTRAGSAPPVPPLAAPAVTLAPDQDDEPGTERMASLLPQRAGRTGPVDDDSHTDRDVPAAPAREKSWRRPRPWKGFVAFLTLIVLGLTASAIWLRYFGGADPTPHPAFALVAPPALALNAGQTRTVEVGLRRYQFNDAVPLTAAAPPRVRVREVVVPAGADRVVVEVTADPDAEKGGGKIRIHAAAGGKTDDIEFPIMIRRPAYLPPGFKPSAGSAAEGDEFYPVIETDRAGLPATQFVLLRPRPPNDPPPFYVMRTKASNDLVAALRAVGGRPAWRFDAGRGSLPALGLTAAEARALAEELGGVLPTARQWDRAADFFNRQNRDGPARGPCVAVGLMDKDPWPVDAADSDDVTPEGVRDLSGNGAEFTRDRLTERKVPGDDSPPRELVVLRGRRRAALKPLTYADLEYQQKTPEVQFESAANPETTFRVVIEPPNP